MGGKVFRHLFMDRKKSFGRGMWEEGDWRTGMLRDLASCYLLRRWCRCSTVEGEVEMRLFAQVRLLMSDTVSIAVRQSRLSYWTFSVCPSISRKDGSVYGYGCPRSLPSDLPQTRWPMQPGAVGK